MAKREFAVRVVDGNCLVWQRVGAPTDARPALQFDVNTVHESLRDAVYAYGVKQIIADGGALERGASIGEKITMMEKRAESLRNGTWGTRTAAAPTITDEAAIEHLRRAGFDVSALVATKG